MARWGGGDYMSSLARLNIGNGIYRAYTCTNLDIMESGANSDNHVTPPSPPLPATSSNLPGRVGKDGTLTVFSKKSERLRKKQLKRGKPKDSQITLLDLPFDILIQVLSLLRASDVFRLSRTCRSLHSFLLDEHCVRVARAIVQWRYPCLEKCMRLPVLISTIPDVFREALQDQERLKGHDIRRRPYYQHIKPPDPDVVCTCLTCVLRWNVLCLAVDFAHWQDSLDANEPLPMIPRGRQPEWNSRLLDSHASVVEKAILRSVGGEACAMWHAVILEAHLNSMVRSIRRHAANKFNKRTRFRLTPQDAVLETDEFLQRKGPPSLDFPFHRDNYYMLEAYLPNRSWFSEEGRWGYMPAEQHDKDLEQLRKWVAWRRSRTQPDKSGLPNSDTWVMNFDGSGWKPVLNLRGRGDQPGAKSVT